jgi:hypothetical protein
MKFCKEEDYLIWNEKSKIDLVFEIDLNSRKFKNLTLSQMFKCVIVL